MKNSIISKNNLPSILFSDSFQFKNQSRLTKKEKLFLRDADKMLNYFFEQLPEEEQRKYDKLIEKSNYLIEIMSLLTTFWFKRLQSKEHFERIFLDIQNICCEDLLDEQKREKVILRINKAFA